MYDIILKGAIAIKPDDAWIVFYLKKDYVFLNQSIFHYKNQTYHIGNAGRVNTFLKIFDTEA